MVLTLSGTNGITFPNEGTNVKAWVNFNGTGSVSIRADGNVGSITDRSTGQYTLNFSNALTDANYSGGCGATIGGSGNNNRSAAVGPVNSSSAYYNTWADNGASFQDVAQSHANIVR